MSDVATHDQIDHHDDHHHEETFLSKYIFSTDHKMIGMQYMFTGLFLALFGGFMALAFRMQLAFPDTDITFVGTLSPTEYNAFVTNHGTIMIFWVAMPVLIAAFGNFLIPLMVGCDDMVFPRLNRLSYQVFLLSAVVILASLFVPGGGFGGAWTAYPPLSANAAYNLTPLGASLWVTAVGLEFAAFLIGGINFVTTAMNARAPGMRAMDVPMVVWMIVSQASCSWRPLDPCWLAPSCFCLTRISAPHFSTRTRVVTPSCGSIYSGSSDTQKSMLFFCQPVASSRTSSPYSRGRNYSHTKPFCTRSSRLAF